MKRSCARLFGFTLFLGLMVNFSPVHAEEKAGVDNSAATVGSIIDLLKEKKIISEEEAAALAQQSDKKGASADSLKVLVDLLRDKGVISGAEADVFVNKAATSAPPVDESAAKGPAVGKMFLPSEDKQFIAILKERWVKNGNEAEDFDDLFGAVTDIEEIIGRMRVMGIVTAEEADELDRQYRDTYLSGVVATTLENRESDYLERIRKNVSWEIEGKILERFKAEWFSSIRLSGDIRLRYQGDYYDPDNGDFLLSSNPSATMNSKVDRHQIRMRARLGVDIKVARDVEAGLGLATGSSSNPVSTNVTLGDSLNKKPFQMDKAYLKWSPAQSLTVWGGRFPNPWFYTDLVWDSDINFDGVAIQYRPQLSNSWSLFTTVGAFPLQEVELSTKDKWLFGGQVGVQYKPSDNVTARLAAAFYDFENTVGIVNDHAQPGLTDYTAPQFQQKGNTLMDIDPTSAIKTAYASEFKELNITGSLDLRFWMPFHVVFTADYVNNLGFNKQEVEARTGSEVEKETEGFLLGMTIGYPKVEDYGQWKGLLAYKHLESDAVMDAFTDSDFHLGGTNAKGWIIGGELGLTKNVWLTTKWLTANEISGPPLAIDVFQFDINAKF